MSTLPPITLAPALPTDLRTIAELEHIVFKDENFSIIAFGPAAGTEENFLHRAESLRKPANAKGETKRLVKAVLDDEIVGFAGYFFMEGRKSSGDEPAVVDEVKDREATEAKDAGTNKMGQNNSWGIGANVRFCEEVLLKGDEYMLEACQGNDYAKLSCLIVKPSLQRLGIGTKLLSQAIAEIDDRNLQSVLSASPQGRDLYVRYGFVVYHIMELKMWEYEGGDGMGVEQHVIMHRPAQKIDGGLEGNGKSAEIVH